MPSVRVFFFLTRLLLCTRQTSSFSSIRQSSRFHAVSPMTIWPKRRQPEVLAGLNNNNEEMSEVKPGKSFDSGQAWITQRQAYANDDGAELSDDTLGLVDRRDYVSLVHLIRYWTNSFTKGADGFLVLLVDILFLFRLYYQTLRTEFVTRSTVCE